MPPTSKLRLIRGIRGTFLAIELFTSFLGIELNTTGAFVQLTERIECDAAIA